MRLACECAIIKAQNKFGLSINRKVFIFSRMLLVSSIQNSDHVYIKHTHTFIYAHSFNISCSILSSFLSLILFLFQLSAIVGRCIMYICVLFLLFSFHRSTKSHCKQMSKWTNVRKELTYTHKDIESDMQRLYFWSVRFKIELNFDLTDQRDEMKSKTKINN